MQPRRTPRMRQPVSRRRRAINTAATSRMCSPRIHIVQPRARLPAVKLRWVGPGPNRITVGHVIEVQTFAGATAPAPWGANTSGTGIVSTAYDGDVTTVTDQASKVRRSMIDGLGRLIRVDEPDASGNLGTATSPAQPTS